MVQSKELNFNGESIYTGMDTHRKQWTVCVRDNCFELKTFTQAPDVKTLALFLKRTYPGAKYYAVYEAGFCGFWIQRGLQAEGINCIVVHAADVPTTDKEKNEKSDPVDCRKLARSLSEGSLKGIYIPTEEMVSDRYLLRTRKQIVKEQTRCKNRIQSMLHFEGIKIPEGYKKSTHFSKMFIAWLEALQLRTTTKESLQLHLNLLKGVRQQLLAANRQIRRLSLTDHYKEQVALLRSIPGIGLTNSMLLLTELGDIGRFPAFDQWCSYFGFTPSTYQSDKTLKVRGITYRCNHVLREALVESAWECVWRDPALLLAFKQYCKRMDKNKAIIRIARKLLSRIRYVLLNKKEYVTSVVK
jgi:transposase